MRLYVLLSFLLFMTSAVSTAPVPKSIDFRLENSHQNSIDQVDFHINVPPADTQRSESNARSLSHDPARKFYPQAKDPQEELVALCEAGFVSGCREAIEMGRAASSPAETSEPQPMSLLESVFSKLNPCSKSENGITRYVAWESFSLSLMVVSAAVVCTLVIARGICKRPVMVQDSKRPHDS